MQQPNSEMDTGEGAEKTILIEPKYLKKITVGHEQIISMIMEGFEVLTAIQGKIINGEAEMITEQQKEDIMRVFDVKIMKMTINLVAHGIHDYHVKLENILEVVETMDTVVVRIMIGTFLRKITIDKSSRFYVRDNDRRILTALISNEQVAKEINVFSEDIKRSVIVLQVNEIVVENKIITIIVSPSENRQKSEIAVKIERIVAKGYMDITSVVSTKFMINTYIQLVIILLKSIILTAINIVRDVLVAIIWGTIERFIRIENDEYDII